MKYKFLNRLFIAAIIILCIIFVIGYIYNNNSNNSNGNNNGWKSVSNVCYNYKREAVNADTLDKCFSIAKDKKYTHIDFYKDGCTTCSQPGFKCYLSNIDSHCEWGPSKTSDNVVSFNYNQ